MTTYNGFGSGDPGSVGAFGDGQPITVGTIFKVTTTGLTAVKVRAWVPSGHESTDMAGLVGRLYNDNTGSLIAEQAFGTLAAGWNEVTISAALTQGVWYSAAVYSPNQGYAAKSGVLSGSDIVNGPLTIPASGTHANGTYIYGNGFPNLTSAGTWFGTDVEVSDAGGGTTQTGTGTLTATDTLTGSGAASRTGSGALSSTATLSGDGSYLRVATGALTAALAAVGTAVATRVATGVRAITATLTGSALSSSATVGASADIAAWFAYQIGIERLTGPGAYGPAFDPPTTELGMVDPGNKLIRTSTGDQVVSSARVFLPISTPAVPNGSRVTLPSTFGSRSAAVLSSLPHVSGLGTPDHLELVLE